MKITKATAIEAAAWLTQYGTPAEAAHQVAVQMTAIRPYVSRDLVAVRAALDFCVSYNDATQDRRVAQLIALSTTEPTRCHFGECGTARCTGCGVTL